MKQLLNLPVFIIILLFFGNCSKPNNNSGGTTLSPKVAEPKNRKDTAGLLTWVQKQHFEYMWSGACPNSGLARVRYYPTNPSQDANTITTGASGFGIMGIIVGIERGFITRAQGVDRLTKIVSFLEKADRWHGMYSHWISDETGKTISFAGSNNEDNGADIVETSFLASGLLCARQYLKDGTDQEKVLSKKIDDIWRGMEWDWFRSPTTDDCLIWHWSPTVGFKKNMLLQGYNETLLTYILAAASPTHPLPDPQKSYMNGWSRKGQMVSARVRYGIPFVVKHNTGANEVGPMFWVAFSYAGFNPKGLKDLNGINYFKANQSHSLIQYNYCKDNPKQWKSFLGDNWGMSAGYTSNTTTDYQAMNTNNDVGVITTNAAIIAMPWVPEQSIATVVHYYWDMPNLHGPWGFWDSFNDGEGIVKRYLANNQCPVAPMIENYRSGLLWNLFMSSPEITPALQALGFTSDN